jgi:hypothetical protein
MKYAVPADLFVAIEDVGAHDVTVTLPEHPGPGTMAVFGRKDTAGPGSLVVQTAGDDCFGGPGYERIRTFVIMNPRHRMAARYERARLDERSEETQGVWFVFEPPIWAGDAT